MFAWNPTPPPLPKKPYPDSARFAQPILTFVSQKFGIYEKPVPPPPPPPPPAIIIPAQSEGFGLADKPPPRSRGSLGDDKATGDEASVASTTETDLPPASGGEVPLFRREAEEGGRWGERV